MEVIKFSGVCVRMKCLYSKPTIALLLGGYFLAVTAGGAFHTHMRHDCGARSRVNRPKLMPGTGLLRGSQSSGSRPSANVENSGVLMPKPIPSDPHCPVCSFLVSEAGAGCDLLDRGLGGFGTTFGPCEGHSSVG